MLVSHDDGSTELVSVQDTSQPHISTYQELEEGEGPHLLIETLPNTPCPSLSPPPVERLSEDSLEDRDRKSEWPRGCLGYKYENISSLWSDSSSSSLVAELNGKLSRIFDFAGVDPRQS